MGDTVIKVENLSKQYRLGLVGTGTLRHDLNRWWHLARGKEDPYLKIGETNDRAARGNSEYVWALRDINFEVKQGEVLGIIGKNGAGKSTLLKILSKVTGPTTGSIKAKGRIASLLEVGTGFHPELTGRENIYLNGTILGMTKAEVDRKLDEIVDFAGVERYLDTPVKRYSSGMKVRLGFAVAAHLEPEILIVDEVLAVGDAEFQRRAVGKMQEVSTEGGRTVLFVSHNMASIQNLCPKVLLIEDGKIEYNGETMKGIQKYIEGKFPTSNNINLIDRTDRIGGNKLKFDKIKFYNKNNVEVSSIPSGEKLIIKVKFKVYQKVEDVAIRVFFYDSKDTPLFSCNNKYVGGYLRELTKDGEVTFIIPKIPLPKGEYKIRLTSAMKKRGLLDEIKNATQFNIVEGDFFSTGRIPTSHEGGVLVRYQFKHN